MIDPDRESLTHEPVSRALRNAGWKPADEEECSNRESWVRGNQRMILCWEWSYEKGVPARLIGTTYAPTDLLDGRLAELDEPEELEAQP